MQTLLSTVENYSQQEKYSLQPTKCKIIKTGKPKIEDNFNFILNDTPIQNVETAVHLGITHSNNPRQTIPIHVQETSTKQGEQSYYNTGHLHNALASIQTSAKDIQRLPIKLRLLTGTYILQSNRAAFNQIDINPTCLLCEEDSETLFHFIHSCPALASARNHHMLELSHISQK
ncbi:Hypothetical predicted protein [Mytilus galloprovincialis]|uniref:Reverse transcriptase zinc-binding domain-containing protein n=1 Tax=Mytilus galloprovincialis TaxID=29158 RepID=A0A8B6D942_MYTGA|nr:Hypothetical predicted protein [Mytilus galloprovincialis]